MNSTASQNRVLIVFYSQSGVTRRMADILQSKTHADVVEIETVKAYPKEPPAVFDEPKRELETGDLPELKNQMPDLSGYGLVLVGGPVWWYTVSTPVMRFLQQADFSGKKTAAFCTHMGGVGQYFPHFEKQAINARVLEGMEIFKPTRTKTAAIEAEFDVWLERLWQA